MTHTPNTPSAEDAPLQEAPKAYAPPALTALGTIEAVTAGPDGGSIDQIIGGGGGFQRDATS